MATESKSWTAELRVGTDKEISASAARSGDHNVIHHDVTLMQANGFKGVFMPGAQLFDFAAASVGTILSGFAVEGGEVRYPHPTFALSRIMFEFKATYRGPVGKVAIVGRNSDGNVVMEATGRLKRVIA
jgi:acyl dehydratase